MAASDGQLAELIAQARGVRPGAGERPVRALLKDAGLTASSERIRRALREATPADPAAGASNGPDEPAGLHLVAGGE